MSTRPPLTLGTMTVYAFHAERIGRVLAQLVCAFPELDILMGGPTSLGSPERERAVAGADTEIRSAVSELHKALGIQRPSVHIPRPGAIIPPFKTS